MIYILYGSNMLFISNSIDHEANSFLHWKYCCCSVAKLCLTLCNTRDCSIPGFPVLHHLLEFVQTHVHWIGDAIQPSHPLLSSSPFAFNLSQHQCLLQWVGSWHQMAKVLELWLKYQCFQWIFRLISFRIDWFDLVVQGTLKSLFQYQNSKALVLGPVSPQNWHSIYSAVL